MGTRGKDIGIAEALFGKTRRQILALLFCNPMRDFYLREIMRLADAGGGSVERELKRLVDSGLVTRRRRGRQVHYQANTNASVFPELKALMTKTVGVADVIRSSLAQVRERIDVALIFGSWAKGTGNEASDIDLLVIGTISFQEMAMAASGIQQRLEREVNPVLYSAVEFRDKVRSSHHFVAEVMNGPKIFLIGDADDLARLGT